MDKNPGTERTPFTLSGAFAAVLRVFMALAAAMLVVGALVFGLTIGLALMAYALLRGRRPQGLRFAWRRGRPAHTPRTPGEVVDVEVREVMPHEPPRG